MLKAVSAAFREWYINRDKKGDGMESAAKDISRAVDNPFNNSCEDIFLVLARFDHMDVGFATAFDYI